VFAQVFGKSSAMARQARFRDSLSDTVRNLGWLPVFERA